MMFSISESLIGHDHTAVEVLNANAPCKLFLFTSINAYENRFHHYGDLLTQYYSLNNVVNVKANLIVRYCRIIPGEIIKFKRDVH